jgi:D-alanine--poly(phosphoribitol) ligase subunit 1
VSAYPYLGMWGGEAAPEWIPDALRRVVTARPDHVAVVDGHRFLTYAHLAGWARVLAGLLRERGVEPGDRVAVAYPRGAEAVVALVGAVVSGATYVPLDTEYPARRLAHMLSDSDPKVLLHDGSRPELTAGRTTVAIPDPAGVRSYDPEADGGLWPVDRDPDRAVYTIYTSGSTGWPKGVEIPYRCLDNMVQWQAAHSPAPDLRTAQFAPLNFDVSFQEVLGTLAGGGTVLVVPERLRREPTELLAWLGEHRVERLFLPYLALQMLAVAARDDLLAGLRLVEVDTAGEQMVCTDQIRALFRRLPGCRLVNHYGQSESAMVTSHILTGPPGQWPALPPLGVPLPGCEVLVAPDDPTEPAVGELLVAGLPRSDGYLHQPELTAERYIDIPPSPHGHTRAFRTGDRVELAGGVLRFLGRVDEGIKFRGTRVDLLEVDAHVLAEPGVAAAATVVVRSRSGHPTLRVALSLVGGAPAPELPAVLGRLREVLPEASVPVSLTVLDALPRTPSGKIDRAAVATLVGAALDAARTPTAAS